MTENTEHENTDDVQEEETQEVEQQETEDVEQESTDTEQDTSTNEESNETDYDSWGETGTDVGNSVITVLQESGLPADKAKALLYDAVQAGDPSKIDEAALAEAMGSAAQARIVVSGVKSHIKEIADKAESIKQSLYGVVGSEDNWKTLSAWARENLSETDLADYIEMVGQGGRKATLAVRDLMEQYEEAGNTSFDTSTVTPKTAKKTKSSIVPLSRREYYDQMELAARQGKLTPSLKEKFWQQRQAGIKAGK